MKKVIVVLCALLLLLSASTAVSAASVTKEDVISNFESGLEVAGVVRYPLDNYVAFAQDFLDSNEFTSDQYQYIIDQANRVRSIWSEAGQASFFDLSSTVQKQIVDILMETAKQLGATLTYDGVNVKLVDANGKTYTLVMSHSISDLSGVIKPTGAAAGFPAAGIFASLSLILVLGSAWILLKSKERS